MARLEYEKFKKLNNIFKAEFNAAFKAVRSEDKNDIFFYFDNIYRVWYYSALFREAFATPAVFADIWFGDDGVNVCLPKIKNEEIAFEWKLYTQEEHPFINDLSVLAQTADEGAAFDHITRELMPESFAEYAPRFTFSDNIYIAYLVEIALELGIIKRIPAIGIARYVSTAKGRNMHQLSTRSALEKAVECACKIFCRKFSAIFGNCPGLNKALVQKWLESTYLTDDIYADLYDLVGFDIVDLWKNDRNHAERLDESERAALSSVYPIGRMIDRYFLTPFGRYFQFIQPIYYNPFSFERELEYIFNNGIRDDYDNALAVFAPSSLYRLTVLGKSMLTDKKKDIPFALSADEMESYLAQMMKYYR